MMFGRWVSFWGVPIFRGETLKIKTSGVYLLVYHITTWAQLLPCFFLKLVVNPRHSPQTQYPGSPIPSMSRPNLAGIQHPPDPKITKKSSLRIYWSNENLTFYQLPNCIDPHHFSKSKSVFFPSKGIWISFILLDPSPKFVTTNCQLLDHTLWVFWTLWWFWMYIDLWNILGRWVQRLKLGRPS